MENQRQLHVYKRSTDTKGTDSWRLLGTADTWRGTHEFRTLTKEQRKDGVSFVYDSHGRFLCTP